MDNRAPSLLKSTLIGGSVFGLLGAIPIVNMINCACCALVIGGGLVATYLYSKECRPLGVPFRAGGGAKIGFVAGLFYAIVNSIMQGLVALVGGQPDFDQILDQMESGGAPPEALETAEKVIELMSGPMGVVIGLGATVLIALVFSTIGGLIGGAIFKVEPPAAPPVSAGGGDVPPATGP